MPERQQLLATAGASLAGLLVTPPRPARVVSEHGAAVYVSDLTSGRVVALVTADAVQLPNALVVDQPASTAPFAHLRAGDEVTIEQGAVRAGDLTVRVARWVDHRLRLAPVEPDRLRDGIDHLATIVAGSEGEPGIDLAEPLARLQSAVAAADLPAAVAAAETLLGLGPGLTPTGDDAVAGVLAAGRTLAQAVGDTRLDQLLHDLGGALLATAADRTTALSATLLWHAARGELAAAARAVLLGVAGRTQLAPAVRHLLGIGHTSGRDLALGMITGARAVLAGAPATTGDR